ncbi:UU173 family protein [Metamycoplasma canadense]|nr:DUF2779 domain-containing protein [Metamycoplasma canadense]
MNKDKKYFTFKDFLKANQSHPWFIFNKVEDLVFKLKNKKKDDIFDQINFYNEEINNLIFKANNAKKILDDKEKEKYNQLTIYEKVDWILQNNVLSNNDNDEQQEEDNIEFLKDLFVEFELIASGSDQVFNQAVKWIYDFYKNEKSIDINKIKIISIKQNTEQRLKETKKAIEDGFLLIINPVFEWENCCCNLLFADIKNKCFGNLIYSNKTEVKNILKSYFDYHITKNYINNLEEIYILKPAYQKNKNIKKGILKFNLTPYCSYKNSKPSIDEEKIKRLSEKEVESIYTMDPNFNYSSNKTKKDNIKIIDHVLSDLTNTKIDFNEKKLPDVKINSDNKYSCSFNEFIKIIKNKDNIKIDINLNNEDSFNEICSKFDIKEIMPIKYPNYSFSSKKVLETISNFDCQIDILKQKQVKKFYDNNLISINPEIENCFEYQVILDNNSKIIWFDFEGVTLSAPMLDYLPGFRQVISQTSIIKTKNNEIYEQNDYVYDPLKFDLNTYKKIIDDLYDEEAKYYIIYNIGYERARIKEIQEQFDIYFEKGDLKEDQYKKYTHKIKFIIDKLVDLYNLFKGVSNNKKKLISDRIINIGFIKGVASIKKIEYFVTHKKIDKYLKHKIIPYATLAVKNGSAALSIAVTRALNLIKDNEWNKKIIDLKKYCHNDVMAMLMTADLIKFLMENKEEYFKNFKDYNI